MASPRINSLTVARAYSREAMHFVLRGPAGFGKTSWLRDYCAQARQSPEAELGVSRVRTVMINATAFATTESISVSESFRRMLARILDGLGVDEVRSLPWDSRPATMLFRYGIERELERDDAHLLLVIDDLDGLRHSRNAVELFDTLRGLGEDGYEEPLSRLRLVVSTATPLNELGNALSSLNHWPELELGPYTEAELRAMLASADVQHVGAEALTTLHGALGGHPKLVELALAETDRTAARLLAWAEQGEGSPGVQRWLEGARHFLLRSQGRVEAVQRALRGEPLDHDIAKTLIRMGLVRRDEGQRDSQAWRVIPHGALLRRWIARQVG